ncbi:RluA family pseudouridine synthase [Gammaproteobacteria bacterium]|jgi:23S rRNA pseudouridine1911/1915/1917 synthase|nr:RluA family pseudouridine synthase [Gammaproteobacteria bacterium]MDA9574708.1 RluA family pseudouridine synthase [Gammaproteobacteria bacterium]MDA9759402.1 RluA family pseudouridine synthase [Gammaproteobacteria bacterium]MDA9920517.1 RluA family pseudouridine synthase [Gammaproteobacteria bacterium]MDB0002888.1 RluA family pseudouridine synthase [Gammaproteobacteria bacterium]
MIKNVPNSLANRRLDKVSSELFPDFSRTQIKKWILEGRIIVNGELSRPKEIVQENDEIEINPIEEKKVSWSAQDIDFEIHHESDDFIIINKPPGLVMHPGSGCYDKTLANGLIFRYPELVNLPRSGIVHRLDKDTSGVLLIAKNEQFRNYFIDQMQQRKVIKEYTAVVVGSTLGSFSIDEPVGRDKFNRTKMSIRPDGKEALTFVKSSKRVGNYSILDISIHTGRTHQIRVHLSSKKLPIVGDNTYDPGRSIAKDSSDKLIEIIRSFPRQALHARFLSFTCHKTKNEISFNIQNPLDMKNLISDIKKHS